MVSVRCRACGAGVLARKSSWEQTSVQWNADAAQRCQQRRAALALAGYGRAPLLLTCSDLSESIRDSARSGHLPIVDDSNVPAT
ncbi:ferredoxin [Mycolicibacterium vaccae]|uniref:ferredoxin n=1 Tax=Mycolicibacterium vaccae TaxID=1810 RepID=UPI003CF460AB